MRSILKVVLEFLFHPLFLVEIEFQTGSTASSVLVDRAEPVVAIGRFKSSANTK